MGLRKQHVAPGSALAFFLGNPVLNPATIVFIGFVLGWQFAALRVGFGIALVLGLALLANRLEPQAGLTTKASELPLAPIEDSSLAPLGIARAWAIELWNEIVMILPGYVAVVLLLGATRAWLFPPGLTLHAAGLPAILGLSLVGTAFVIPTAGEVPIVQTLMQHGMGVGPAAALLVTLPAISLPSLFIVRKVFSKRVLSVAAAGVFMAGVAAGLVAIVALHG